MQASLYARSSGSCGLIAGGTSTGYVSCGSFRCNVGAQRQAEDSRSFQIRDTGQGEPSTYNLCLPYRSQLRFLYFGLCSFMQLLDDVWTLEAIRVCTVVLDGIIPAEASPSSRRNSAGLLHLILRSHLQFQVDTVRSKRCTRPPWHFSQTHLQTPSGHPRAGLAETFTLRGL